MTRRWLVPFRRARAHRPAPIRPNYRPALEALEDRWLPSVNVLTAHNDISRDGLNAAETVLTPANVNSAQFGKLFSAAVDGQVYAQPLYLGALPIPGQGTHDVVFAATEHDSVYALDAGSGAVLWQDSFIDPAAGINPMSSADLNTSAIAPEIGITSTPVIDPTTGTLYVVAATEEVSGSATNFVQRLHALDVTTGAEKFGGPVAIQAAVPGTGDGGSTVTFLPEQELQRTGLLLLDGVVYVAFTSHDDHTPAHGWVMGYGATTLQQVAVFSSSPNTQLNTIWMSGGGLAGDAGGHLYLVTGNGPVENNSDGFDPAAGDYAETALKLDTGGGLSVSDYFTPSDWQLLDATDTDFGSGGVLLLDQPGAAAPHLLITAGKEGEIYLINRDSMGQFNAGGDDVVQELPGAMGGSFGSPAYFDNTLYYGGTGDFLRALSLTNDSLSAVPSSQSATRFGYPGTTPSVSADGTANGIVWAIENAGGQAILHAYDATDLTNELYNSDQAGSRDWLDAAVKFTTPTIADGRVFVGTQSQLTVFGELTDLNWSGGGLSSVPATANTAAPFTISRSYDVSGAAVANDFTISYYASAGGTPDPANDDLLGTETVSAAADQAVGLHTGTSPALQFPSRGTWYVYAFLDSGNAVAERNETNNLFVAPQQVTVTGAAVVNNSDAGYAESGPDWQDRTTSGGYEGDLAFAPAGTGQDTASWQVSNLAPGNYEVDATWYAYPNRATNAPFSICDGSTLLAMVSVNQQQAPAGTAVGGFPFQSLGTFHVTSGTLKVVLSNNANGYVIADAVRAMPVLLVDNGQAGYTESGPDWQDRQTSLGYGGNLAYAPAGTGQDTATWQLTNLAAGTYEVDVTWYAYSNRASNAPYNVYDGGTLLTPTPILVNQQQAPSGTTLNGFPFQSLGQFTIQSGTLKVVLSNNANGFVFADALCVNPLPAPAIDLNWDGGGITGPTSAATGTPFTIARTYNVTGGPAPGSFTISYYASTHATLGNPDDVLLGAETISAAADLAAGTHAGTSPALQFPSAGTYYLYAFLDSGNVIAETNENNNVAQAPTQVTVAGPVIVDNGQPGYTESGPDWQDRQTSAGYGGNLAYAPAGTGQDTATWQLTNLAAGTYEVDVTWYAYSNRASNVPYNVYDGGTLLTASPILVNQQVAPSGTIVNGFPFQPLGTFSIQSGTLKVVLSNSANGYVFADALRLVQLPAPVIDLNWNGGGLTGPTSATTGTPFTLSRAYNVSGATPLTGFTISYYASTHATPGNPDDVLLGTETISAVADLTVGTHASTSPSLQIATAGIYYLYAVLDSGNVVAESNEGNNVAQAPAQVTVTTAPPPVGPVIVDNGQPGYTESGPDWQDRTTSAGYGGVLAYAPAGSGQDTASWQVSNLAAGSYEVDATWYAYGNRASNAPYNVYDGATLLTASPILVNQQQAPSGITVNGFPFQSLGTFNVMSGTINVVLSNAANGYVFAEAVRFAPVKPTYLVDNGQAGYTESGPDWQDRNTSLGYGGNLAYAPAGTGQDTVSWQLTNLAPGTYDVQTTWYAYGNRATNAPYSIYDGSTLLATVTVNQQQAPSGTAVNGFPFQSLGTFTIQSGTLRVVLSNNADGYVFADALRVVLS